MPAEKRAGTAQSLPFWHYLVAAVLGAANTLSFAPTPHGGWLELVIFTLFFAWLTRTSGWKSAALTGWAFGFGNFVTGVWWLYVSMHDYGGMAAPLAAAAVALFSMYLAIYPALAGVVWSLCAGRARYDDNEDVSPPCLSMNRASCPPGTARLHSRARGRWASGCAALCSPASRGLRAGMRKSMAHWRGSDLSRACTAWVGC
jgi:hypothetical protein